MSESEYLSNLSLPDALDHVDSLLDQHRHGEARVAFRTAMRDDLVTTWSDLQLLNTLALTFVRKPYQLALNDMRRIWNRHPEHRDMLAVCVPRTDPGLFDHPLFGVPDIADTNDLQAVQSWQDLMTARAEPADQRAPRTVPLERTEWKPAPSRALYMFSRQPRVHFPNRFPVTLCRIDDPDQLSLRPRREKRRPVAAGNEVVANYMNDDLFVDAYATEAFSTPADDAPAPANSASTTKPEDPESEDTDQPSASKSEQGKPKRTLVDSRVACRRWDAAYNRYVADQYDMAAVRAGKTPIPEESIWNVVIGRTGVRVKPQDEDRVIFDPYGGDLGFDVMANFAENEVIRADELREAALGMVTTSMATDYRIFVWPCVSCHIDRSASENQSLHCRDGQFRSDDGLCDMCRATDQKGIPALPEGFTITDLVRARCEFLITEYPDAARALLTEILRRRPRRAIYKIVYMLRQQLSGGAARSITVTTRTRQPSAPKQWLSGRCRRCQGYGKVHRDDDRCARCRAERAAKAARSPRVAA